VSACPACARCLEETRQLVFVLAGAPRRQVSDSFEHHLMAALRETAPASSGAAWWERFRLHFEWRLRVPAMVAATSLAAALVVGLAMPVVNQQAERRHFVTDAVARHRQLEHANPDTNWDAIEASIHLSTGNVTE
jgi:anti-sigma-K factor RskA